MSSSDEHGCIGLRWTGRLLAKGLALIAATWRVEGLDVVRSEIERRRGTPLLVGFWHGKYIPLLALLRGTPAHIFVGEGRRGARLAEICRAFGFSPTLLPHGDRARAIARMRSSLSGPLPCATPLDGPIGPQRRVKPALVRLASDANAVILPISMSARPRVVLRRRWDRREIPWPFARVSLCVGATIPIPAGLSAAERSERSERVRAALDALDADTPRKWTGSRRGRASELQMPPDQEGRTAPL